MLRQALIVGVLAVSVPASIAYDAESTTSGVMHSPPAELQDGDLVFRRGRDAIGRIVLGYGDQPRFSHVGMVVRIGEQVMIAHALPETASDPGGVRLDPLHSFSSPTRASDVGYFRPRVLATGQREEIRRYLLESVGTPFDLRFKFSTDDAMYCTELVLKALAQVGIDLAPSLKAIRVITVDEPAFAPDALRQSQQLQELMSKTE